MKMKAAVIYELGAAQPYAKSQPVRVEEVDLDPPQANEVLISFLSCCPSDSRDQHETLCQHRFQL